MISLVMIFRLTLWHLHENLRELIAFNSFRKEKLLVSFIYIFSITCCNYLFFFCTHFLMEIAHFASAFEFPD